MIGRGVLAGRDQAEPYRDVEVGHAGLGHGRKLEHRFGALAAGGGERAQLAASHVRQRAHAAFEHHVDLAAEEIGDGR